MWQLEYDLEDFIGGMGLTKSLERYFKINSEVIESELYRGLPFPKHLLKEGTIIEEWGGCSHWSYSEDIAIDFAKGTYDEFYFDELEELYGEGNVELVPVIMYSKYLKGSSVGSLVSKLGLDEDYYNCEEEVVIIGKNFKIISILKEFYKGLGIYYVNVKPISNDSLDLEM